MPEPSFVQRFLRERALSRYLAALERGDINAVISVLEQSSKDGALEQMIFDLHETYQTEEEFLAMAQAVQDEPDVIEVENGVFKSRLEGKLPNLRHTPRRSYRLHERVVQVLVAATLILCVVGSMFMATGLQQTQEASQPSPTNPCISTGAPVSADDGTPILSQVVAITPQDIWAVGSIRNSTSSLRVQPLLEHWDGASWNIVNGANTQALLQSSGNWDQASLSHIAVISADDIWAVGGVGAYSYDAYSNYQSSTGKPLIEHWNGWQWQLVPGASGITESYSVLNDLVAISANNIWAVGFAADSAWSHTTALVEHWDGSRWTRVPQPQFSPQVGVLDHISATSASDIWVIGRASPFFQTFPLIEHWDGHTWSVTYLSAAGLGAANALVTLSASDIWVAGSAPQVNSDPVSPLIIHWNGQSWTRAAGNKELGAGNTILGLKIENANDIWAAGSAAGGHSLILHWNGQRWKTIQHQSPPFAYLSDIAISGGRIWAVGGTYGDIFEQDVTGALIETSC